MLHEKLSILKVMNESTGHVTFNEFANMVGLTQSETLEKLHELAETGHVRKVGNGYGLTEMGRGALKALTPVNQGSEFEFYIAIGRSLGSCASNPIEFYEIVKRIDVTSLEFHMSRKDFENWVRSSLDNSAFADELANLQGTGVCGEGLRSAIIKAFETAYCLP